MNEKSFQEFLEKKFSFSHGLGIGDDAAVVRQDERFQQVITKDILLENVHFKMDYFSFEDLAQKAISVNLSDIAAMGAVPEYFFLGIGMPKNYQKHIIPFFEGIKRSCDLYNIELGGGDFSSSGLFFISITMIGKSINPILRKNAQTGDKICITKNPGESALGLKLLQSSKEHDLTSDELFFTNKHKQVIPELTKGQILSAYASSMMDISDGLIKDLKRMLYASKRGAIVHYEKIPVSKKFKLICAEYNINEDDLILAGGEDYGLLFTISKEKEKLLNKQKIKYTIIGAITEGRSLSIIKNNKPLNEIVSGYDHFTNF